MREIKFRAWDKFNGEMMTIRENKSLANFFHKVELLQDGGNGIELMQFTGLLDKNGKEIYEGDLIKYFYADYKDPCIIQVAFYAPGFDIPEETEVEIIGNIYENPELLKQTA